MDFTVVVITIFVSWSCFGPCASTLVLAPAFKACRERGYSRAFRSHYLCPGLVSELLLPLLLLLHSKARLFNRDSEAPRNGDLDRSR